MITKELKEDKIEIVGDYKAVQVRTATVISEDGVGNSMAIGLERRCAEISAKNESL
jgi:hypothetical protein